MKTTFLTLIFALLLPSLPSLGFAKTLAQKIDDYSRAQIDKPYGAAGPLGEGKGYDKDPLYRFDMYDCTTFVETILALSISNDRNDFLRDLNEIRYKDGEVSFLKRNHITSIDWIKNNQKNGLLSDVTINLFPKEVLISKTEIDKAAWFKTMHHMNVKEKKQISNLAYLPISAVLTNPRLLGRISSGSVINIVRPNWQLKAKAGTNLDVSHQGFAIIKSNGVLYFRHASVSLKKVTEEPMLSYLKRMSANKTIGGINILELN